MRDETKVDREIKKMVTDFVVAFKEVGPKNAFGDPLLVKLVREVAGRMEYIER